MSRTQERRVLLGDATMQYGIYIGPTPITEYGCVKCQKYHRKGLDAEYDDHIYHQSKHGIRERAPHGIAEEFVAHFLANKTEGNLQSFEGQP